MLPVNYWGLSNIEMSKEYLAFLRNKGANSAVIDNGAVIEKA